MDLESQFLIVITKKLLFWCINAFSLLTSLLMCLAKLWIGNLWNAPHLEDKLPFVFIGFVENFKALFSLHLLSNMFNDSVQATSHVILISTINSSISCCGVGLHNE